LPGWIVQYGNGDDSGSRVTLFSLGLVQLTSFKPSAFLVTSSRDGALQSALWRGVYGPLEVTQVVHFAFDEQFATISVTVRNIGSQPVTDFYCEQRVAICMFLLIYCCL
jgi:hypothetical protein